MCARRTNGGAMGHVLLWICSGIDGFTCHAPASCIWYRASSSVVSADTRVFVASQRGYWHGACVCRVAPAGSTLDFILLLGKHKKLKNLFHAALTSTLLLLISLLYLCLIKSRTEAHLFFQINQFTSDHPSLDTVEPVVCSLRVQTVRA